MSETPAPGKQDNPRGCLTDQLRRNFSRCLNQDDNLMMSSHTQLSPHHYSHQWWSVIVLELISNPSVPQNFHFHLILRPMKICISPAQITDLWISLGSPRRHRQWGCPPDIDGDHCYDWSWSLCCGIRCWNGTWSLQHNAAASSPHDQARSQVCHECSCRWCETLLSARSLHY